MTKLRVRTKTWLEVDEHPFLGDGRYRLLMAVLQNGSISSAAKALGISYRKAWSQLQALEEISPVPLLERRTGGRGGGETHLTEAALDLMHKFESLRAQVNNAADRIFTKYFKSNATIDSEAGQNSSQS